MINCPNAIIRQCILNAYYNANSLIGYKKSKPNVLLDEQQAQVNCLYTLCQAKSSHLKINGLLLVNACFCIQCLHLPYYYGYMSYYYIIYFLMC